MSLKDKLFTALGPKNYEAGRGLFHGVFLSPTHFVNARNKNYSNKSYVTAGSFFAPFAIVGAFLGLPLSVYHAISYVQGGNHLPNSLKEIIEISALLVTTNILSLAYEIQKYKENQKTNPNNILQISPQQPKEPTKIDPWCELEEPEQKTVDPWCELENKLQ